MRNFIIGIAIGLVLGGGVAWAAMRISLQDGAGNELGNTANPINISQQ